MRLRSHRRNIVMWSAPAAAPASKSAAQRFTRLARTMRTRWRPMFLLTGAMLTVVGVTLPSGAALFPGLLVLLFALLQGLGVSDCRAANQLAEWPWRG